MLRVKEKRVQSALCFATRLHRVTFVRQLEERVHLEARAAHAEIFYRARAGIDVARGADGRQGKLLRFRDR